ncbi:MAG: flagellar biosynthetic protein FliQ [Pirellulaceae bacterium]|jgi:flagellar biosynthetic protein FliQ
MDGAWVSDGVQQALLTTLLLASPLLLVALLVGGLFSFLQGVFQIQDSAVSAIPKWLATLLVAMLLLPWMTERLVEFSQDLYRNIPASIGR